MKVKEVIALAAENLGREDLSSELETLDGAPEGELKSLLRCYNLVENEVALDYFPLKAEEEVLPQNGRIPYSELAHAPVNFFRMRGGDGRDVDFEAHPAYLSVPAETGALTVVYAYSPEHKEIVRESEFSGKITARLLSYGVACEFCLTSARYAEAALWERRFRDALRAAEIIRRRLKVRARRWL